MAKGRDPILLRFLSTRSQWAEGLELLGLLGDRRQKRELCMAIELLLVLKMVLGLLLFPGPSREDRERVAGRDGDNRTDRVLSSARGRSLDEIGLG